MWNSGELGCRLCCCCCDGGCYDATGYDDGDCDGGMTSPRKRRACDGGGGCYGVPGGYGDGDYCDGDMMGPMKRTAGGDGDGAKSERDVDDDDGDGDDVVAVASWLMNYALSNHYCRCHCMERARVVLVGLKEGF